MNGPDGRPAGKGNRRKKAREQIKKQAKIARQAQSKAAGELSGPVGDQQPWVIDDGAADVTSDDDTSDKHASDKNDNLGNLDHETVGSEAGVNGTIESAGQTVARLRAVVADHHNAPVSAHNGQVEVSSPSRHNALGVEGDHAMELVRTTCGTTWRPVGQSLPPAFFGSTVSAGYALGRFQDQSEHYEADTTLAIPLPRPTTSFLAHDSTLQSANLALQSSRPTSRPALCDVSTQTEPDIAAFKELVPDDPPSIDVMVSMMKELQLSRSADGKRPVLQGVQPTETQERATINFDEALEILFGGTNPENHAAPPTPSVHPAADVEAPEQQPSPHASAPATSTPAPAAESPVEDNGRIASQEVQDVYMFSHARLHPTCPNGRAEFAALIEELLCRRDQGNEDFQTVLAELSQRILFDNAHHTPAAEATQTSGVEPFVVGQGRQIRRSGGRRRAVGGLVESVQRPAETAPERKEKGGRGPRWNGRDKK